MIPTLRMKLRTSTSQLAFLVLVPIVSDQLAQAVCWAASYPLHPSVPNPLKREWGLG